MKNPSSIIVYLFVILLICGCSTHTYNYTLEEFKSGDPSTITFEDVSRGDDSTRSVFTGNIIDKTTNEPLYGALVIVKDSISGKINGVVANEKGEFTLPMKPGLYVVTIKYIGFMDLVYIITAFGGEKRTIHVSLGEKYVYVKT